MQDLIKQEIFELEVLEKLKNNRILEPLVFVGGTMLRLCHDLNRYSVDLDFWLIKKVDIKKYFTKIVDVLKEYYTITDSKIKYYTILVEIKSDKYPRKLKVEIRKEKECEYEEKIAFSKYTNIQVLLKCATLKQMLKNKIEAFLERKEIRDCFDIEFILRRGEELELNKEKLGKMLSIIKSFTANDYKVTLGSILKPEVRKYYIKSNFKYLIEKINDKLSELG
jgi:5'-3' exonuclease